MSYSYFPKAVTWENIIQPLAKDDCSDTPANPIHDVLPCQKHMVAMIEFLDFIFQPNREIKNSEKIVYDHGNTSAVMQIFKEDRKLKIQLKNNIATVKISLYCMYNNGNPYFCVLFIEISKDQEQKIEWGGARNNFSHVNDELSRKMGESLYDEDVTTIAHKFMFVTLSGAKSVTRRFFCSMPKDMQILHGLFRTITNAMQKPGLHSIFITECLQMLHTRINVLEKDLL